MQSEEAPYHLPPLHLVSVLLSVVRIQNLTIWNMQYLGLNSYLLDTVKDIQTHALEKSNTDFIFRAFVATCLGNFQP